MPAPAQAVEVVAAAHLRAVAVKVIAACFELW